MPEEEQKPNFYDLYKTVGKIDGKLDGVLTHLEKLNGRLDNHNKKIDALETTTDQIVGKISVIGAFFGVIGATIVSIIKGKFFQ